MILKIVFLLIIVIIALYFMFPNKNTEHFTTDNTTLIKNIYQNEIKRDPSQKELEFFIDFMKNQNVSEEDLRTVIRDSADVVAATFQTTPDDDIIGIYGTEENVIEIFNNVLDRNPDAQELPLYSKKLAKDKDFNTDKLKLVLYSTPEYARMQKTQDNKTFSALPGGVTERQLVFILLKLFKEVTGKNDPGDKLTLDFLKKKFVEFDLDADKMRRFLINYFSDQKYIDQEQIQVNIHSNSNKHENNTNTVQENKPNNDTNNNTNKSTNTVDNKKNNCHMIDGSEYCMVQTPNKKIIEDMLRTSKADSDYYLDSANVLDLIKKQPNCVYDQKKMALKSDESAADAYLSRCMDNMKSTCKRNKDYLGNDEDLVLLPDQKWSVPQFHPPVCVGGDTTYKPQIDQTALIGTLLDDANHTKIGNVLPLYPPGRP